MTATPHSEASLNALQEVPAQRGALMSRLAGPGGYYNIGNLIGLATGLGLQLSRPVAAGSSAVEGIVTYLVGSPAALALTLATTIFLFAGEMYHRAWRTGELDTDLNRVADLLSALGALALVACLSYLNQPVLAALTGLLIVGGKLGSAIYGDQAGPIDLWPSQWPDAFRCMVLAGRMAGLAAAILELAHQLAVAAPLSGAIQPTTMVLCQLLWVRADVLLFKGRAAA